MSRFKRILPTDKNYVVKVTSADGEAEYLDDKILIGNYITKTVGDSSGTKTITLDVDLTEVNSALGTVVDEKVKVNSATTTSGYLADKLKATANITMATAADNSDLTIKWSASFSDLSNVTAVADTGTSFVMFDSASNVVTNVVKIFNGTDFDTSAGTPSIELVTREDILGYLRDGQISDASGNGIFWDTDYVRGGEAVIRVATSAGATLSDSGAGEFWSWTGSVTYNDTTNGAYRKNSNGIFLTTTHNSATGTYVGTSLEIQSVIPELWDSTTDPKVDFFLVRPPTTTAAATNQYAIQAKLMADGETDTSAATLTASITLSAAVTDIGERIFKTLVFSDTACEPLDTFSIKIAMSSTANTTDSITDNTGAFYGARFRYRTKSIALRNSEITDG